MLISLRGLRTRYLPLKRIDNDRVWGFQVCYEQGDAHAAIAVTDKDSLSYDVAEVPVIGQPIVSHVLYDWKQNEAIQ